MLLDGKPAAAPGDAARSVVYGSLIEIRLDAYSDLIVVPANSVRTWEGACGIECAQAEGKATLVIKVNGTMIENLETHGVQVHRYNGACVHQEGGDLSLRPVYIYSSEQGLLTGAEP